MGATAASGLGALALLLACTGVYGVVAFAVSRRTREIGIRIALGAAKRDVLRLILWQGLRPVLIGAVIGLALAIGAARVLRAMLFGVSTADPIAFAGMAAILMLVALAATLFPARAALQVEPVVALRQD